MWELDIPDVTGAKGSLTVKKKNVCVLSKQFWDIPEQRLSYAGNMTHGIEIVFWSYNKKKKMCSLFRTLDYTSES